MFKFSSAHQRLRFVCLCVCLNWWREIVPLLWLSYNGLEVRRQYKDFLMELKVGEKEEDQRYKYTKFTAFINNLILPCFHFSFYQSLPSFLSSWRETFHSVPQAYTMRMEYLKYLFYDPLLSPLYRSVGATHFLRTHGEAKDMNHVTVTHVQSQSEKHS